METTNQTIAVIFDVPGMSAESYDRILAGLEEAGEGAPDGRRYHVAVAKPDGWFVLDVWESQAQLDRFAQTLIPIIQREVDPPPQPQVYPVHNIVKG